ncbi:hypothetical protein ACFO0M_10015 [Micromonospora mangrovi]|uniref:Uncharacterized protein n=2 Tax=Micromonospora TaxID=1873 RepID=A0AAU8HC91_9ACTN
MRKPDDQLQQVLAERYGSPVDVAVEQSAPPPVPVRRLADSTDGPQRHRRRALLDALRPKGRAA